MENSDFSKFRIWVQFPVEVGTKGFNYYHTIIKSINIYSFNKFHIKPLIFTKS